MDHSSRTASLGDYLRVVREHRLLIVVLVVVCAGVAFGLSKTQNPTYAAKATLAFRDESQDLTLVGQPSAPADTADQAAAAGAQTIVTARVLRRVKDQLHTSLSVAALGRKVDASAEQQSRLVQIEARAGDAHFAARLANAVARAGVLQQTMQERRRFEAQAIRLRQRLGTLDKASRTPTVVAGYEQNISTLQSLSTLAQPVDVTTVATVPSSPVSPKPVRNAALGGLLGLLVGLGVAFARDSLDRRLKGTAAIESSIDLPIMGHVGEEVMGSAAGVGPGADDAGRARLEAFRIIRMNLEYLAVDRPLRSLVVTSAMPSEGKSTTAAGLAAAYASAGRRTLLVECDLRHPSLADRLGLSPTPGLVDYVMGRSEPGEVVRAVPLLTQRPVAAEGTNGSSNSNHAPNGSNGEATTLACILAGELTPQPGELLASERFKAFLAEVTAVYEMVVLDTAPLLSVVDTLELVPEIDGVVLCVRDGQTTRDQSQAAVSALRRLPPRPTGLVVSGLRYDHPGYYGGYAYGYGYGYETAREQGPITKLRQRGRSRT